MADQRTIAELLRAPTEGYAEAIVVPPIPAEHFKLKHSLINLVTSNQFFSFEKGDPHAHIQYFNKITSMLKYKDVPEESIKLMLFHFLSMVQPGFGSTKNLLVLFSLGTIFDACDRFKDLLRACPHYGFTELHQLDTFYNGLNPSDQDSLNYAASGNLLERSAQDVLKIIENKSKVRNSRNKPIVSQVKTSNVDSSEIASAVASAATSAMTAIFKQHQVTPAPASVKAVEESCVTCGGTHSYRQCPATDGNTFSGYHDNIQGYVSAAAVNYNQGNTGYRPPSVANQTRPSGFAHPYEQNNQNRYNQGYNQNKGNSSYQAPTQQTQITTLSELEKFKKTNKASMQAMRNHIGNLKSELRNEMQATMSNQTNEIKNMMASFFQMNTASSSGLGPLPSNTIANPKGKLKAITTQSGIVLDGPSVPMPPSFINPEEDERVEDTLTDPKLVEYTIKLNCKALADLGASINLITLDWKNRLSKLISTRMTLELANRSVCTPAGIARDVFVFVGRFTSPADFVIVDYESDPRVPLILERPFLRTARALIDVHGEELILRDGDERLILNMKHGTSSYSNNHQRESINMIDIYTISYKDYLEDLFANEKITNHLRSFANELALIESFPSGNDDMTLEDVIREIEYLLNRDPLYSPNNDHIYTIPEMFTDEHALDYSSHPRYDDADDDPFDSKENKIKVSKLLVDELDSTGSSSCLPHFLECDPVLYEDFSKVDTLTSTDNKDKARLCLSQFVVFCCDGPRIIAPDYIKPSRALGIGYSLKDKNEAKPDKTKHENGKSVKINVVHLGAKDTIHVSLSFRPLHPMTKLSPSQLNPTPLNTKCHLGVTLNPYSSRIEDKEPIAKMIGLGDQANLMARMDFGLLSHKKNTLSPSHRTNTLEDPRPEDF
ncbi:reverse transcriptase domain-containing protein [Tanacetum coccineum]